jgi:hypothetical protein
MRDNMAPSYTFLPVGDGDCSHLEEAVALPTAFTLVEVGSFATQQPPRNPRRMHRDEIAPDTQTLPVSFVPGIECSWTVGVNLDVSILAYPTHSCVHTRV